MMTPLQSRIELSVTGGLGYDSRTDFSKSYSIYSDYLSPEEVKNTSEGLKAHLRELASPEYRLYGVCSGFLFSSTGIRMDIMTSSKFRDMQMKWKNRKLIDKAYNTLAREQGRINTFVSGFMKKAFRDNPLGLIEYLNSTNSS
ncbi:MAG: hypothetical protein ABIH79_02465 [archaeon]